MVSVTSEPAQEVGERFHPTDKELVSHYLRKKLLHNDHQFRKIPEAEVYKLEPYDLPGKFMTCEPFLLFFFLF